jgi:uncharacterized RDD family membrane protein YckC
VSAPSSPAGRPTRPRGGAAASAYPGQRLGLPADGPGSSATWGRRFAALLVDWLASLLVATGATGGAALTSHGWEAWVPMLVFLIEATVLTPLAGGSFGQVLLGVAVLHLDRRPLSLLAALVRTLLVCVVVPPLIYNVDRRGLHDLGTASMAVRR